MTANRQLAQLVPLPSANFGYVWSAALGWVPAPVAPNLLINGNFSINQRSFAGGALAAGSYGFDRWGAYNGGANYSVAATGLLTLTSGTLCQVVEAPLGSAFASRTYTFSVDSPSGPLTVTLGSGSGSGAVFGTITAGSGRRSVTLTTPSTVGADLKVRVSGTNVTFRRAKLELGSYPTDFDDVLDLQKCQRFFQKSYLQGTAPGAGGSANYPGIIDYFAPASTTTQINVYVKMPVTMRAVPTVTLYDLAGAAGMVYRGGNGQPADLFAVGDASFNGVSRAGVSATELAFHWTANAELACTD